MALTLADADAMLQACDVAGIQLFIVQQQRFNPAVKTLRRAFEAGRFGRIVMSSARVRWKRDQNYYDQDSWRGSWDQDGGVFANQANHYIDMLKWFLGEPKSVYAIGHTALAKNIETEDTGIAALRFESGALGVIEATTATRPHDWEGSFSLLGEYGSAEIVCARTNIIRHWAFTYPEPEDDAIIAQTTMPCYEAYFPHQAYLSHVVRAVREGAVREGGPNLIDGVEGRQSLELLTAIYESMARGTEIKLSSQSRNSQLDISSSPH